MSFKVTITKLSEELVVPSEPTPVGRLPLSWLDKHPSNRRMMEVLSVFERGHEPASVIRRALAKALVSYYPLAGRLVESERGELEVACMAQGACLVEAVANCSLRDVNFLGYPLMIPDELLLPQAPHDEDLLNMPLLMQVTKFKCGGFAVCLVANHIIMDGIGAGQFLRAVAELTRGLLQQYTLEPIWCRDVLPNFLDCQPGCQPPTNDFQPELAVMDISLENINKVKKQFMSQTGQSCSTFDVLAAKAWQCRTRVIKKQLDSQVHLLLPIDARHWIKQMLPQGEGGYYGNCNYALIVKAATERIVHASIVEVASLIKDARERMRNEFPTDQKEDPLQLISSYGSMIMNDWNSVGISEVDYGWGEPIQHGPLRLGGNIALCFHAKSPKFNHGTARLITYCVKKEHLVDFHNHMLNFT